MNLRHHSADSACSRGPRPCRRPLPKSLHFLTFFLLHFWDAPNLQELRQRASPGIPLGTQNQPKSTQNASLTAVPKKDRQSQPKSVKNGNPALVKTSVSLQRGCIFAVLQGLQQSAQNDVKMVAKMLSKSSKMGAGGLSNAMQKIAQKTPSTKYALFAKMLQTRFKKRSKSKPFLETF